MSAAELFERVPAASGVLRHTVYANGYAAGVDLAFPASWNMRAADKAWVMDQMRDAGLATHDRKLTDAGLALACRLTS